MGVMGLGSRMEGRGGSVKGCVNLYADLNVLRVSMVGAL